jgi:hypothetical protein
MAVQSTINGGVNRSGDRVSELESVPPTVETADQGEESKWKSRDGRGGLNTRTESRADELRRKGAFLGDEHYEVVEAETTGTDADGTVNGRALIRRTPYEEGSWVDYADLWMPSDTEMHNLHQDNLTRVPDYLETEVETRQEIIDDCPVDVFCMSANRFWSWPHKLFSYYKASPTVAESGDTIMVDSGHNRWGSPQDVLEAAAKVNADLVFATDVTGMEDPENKYHNDAMPEVADVRHEIRAAIEAHDDPQATVESLGPALEGVTRFVERARELEILDRTVLPVQAPYTACLEIADELGLFTPNPQAVDAIRYVAVGGLLNIDEVADRIAALNDVRDYVGDNIKVHALAPGRDPEMMLALRDNPTLIDSLDNSTPEQAPPNNQIADATGSQIQHLFPHGQKSSTLRGAAALLQSLETAHLLSDNLDVESTFPGLVDDQGYTEPDDQQQQQISEWAADD